MINCRIKHLLLKIYTLFFFFFSVFEHRIWISPSCLVVCYSRSKENIKHWHIASFGVSWRRQRKLMTFDLDHEFVCCLFCHAKTIIYVRIWVLIGDNLTFKCSTVKIIFFFLLFIKTAETLMKLNWRWEDIQAFCYYLLFAHIILLF